MLHSVPTQLPHLKNYSSLLEFHDLIDAELHKLIDKGILEQVQHRPHIVSPLGTVPKSTPEFSRACRLIVDLRASGLNDCIIDTIMRLPTIRDIVRAAKR